MASVPKEKKKKNQTSLASLLLWGVNPGIMPLLQFIGVS